MRLNAFTRSWRSNTVATGASICRTSMWMHCLLISVFVCPLFGQERLPLAWEKPVKSTENAMKTDKARDIFELRVRKFQVQNATLRSVVEMIDALGIQLCWEEVVGENQFGTLDGLTRYVDEQGVQVCHADKLLNLNLVNVPVPELLDAVVKADSRYVWTRVPDTNVLILEPHVSQLDFEVGPVKEIGNPIDILLHMANNPTWQRIAPANIVGGHYPTVSLNVDRCSARELLNLIARQRTGLSWICRRTGTILRYVPKALVQQVKLLYPTLVPGEPTALKTQYNIKWDYVENGWATAIVEKTTHP
jgi:hypothetical protein